MYVTRDNNSHKGKTMNYQALKFIATAMETFLKNEKKLDLEYCYGKEFLAAVQDMLTATKNLMKFF